MDDELLVYDLRRSEAMALNPFAARVWRACDGALDVAGIARRLGRDKPVAEGDVAKALETLRRAALLDEDVDEDDAPAAGRGRTRRTMLAFGAGTVAVVTSLATAAAAAGVGSCATGGDPCIDGACCPGFTCVGDTCEGA